MLWVPGSNQTREPNHGLRFANPTKVTGLRVFFLYWSQEDASSADIVGSPHFDVKWRWPLKSVWPKSVRLRLLLLLNRFQCRVKSGRDFRKT
jgi:hypothetical protein